MTKGELFEKAWRLGFKGDFQLLGYANSPCPTPRNLELEYYPTPTSICNAILRLTSRKADMIIETSPEIKSFRGPF